MHTRLSIDKLSELVLVAYTYTSLPLEAKQYSIHSISLQLEAKQYYIHSISLQLEAKQYYIHSH